MSTPNNSINSLRSLGAYTRTAVPLCLRPLLKSYVSSEFKMRFLFIFVLIELTACTTMMVEKPNVKSNFFVGIKDGVLIYQGSITKSSNLVIFQVFEKAIEKPKRLIISSPGGEIGVGMDLGEWIHSNKLNIEIKNICLSSCANYVFPAGNIKYLHKDSILMWHGSAWQKTWDTANSDDKFHTSYLPNMRERETAFYHRIGIDNFITVYGHSEITIWDQFKSFFGSSLIGWDYSLDDIKRFGISNISLMDNDWNWREYQPSVRNSIKRISLKQNYELRLHRFET